MPRAHNLHWRGPLGAAATPRCAVAPHSRPHSNTFTGFPRLPPLLFWQGIEDHFLEQWHQKLHTNTTPEDITICEAYLAFLRSGDMGEFW